MALSGEYNLFLIAGRSMQQMRIPLMQ